MTILASADVGSQGLQDAYEALLRRCRPLEPVITAVVHPCEKTTMASVMEATEAGLIIPILVGPDQKIRKAAQEARVNIGGIQIEDVPHSHAAAAKPSNWSARLAPRC